MTPKQALTQARKRWGKRAAVECQAKGAFIGDDGNWHEGHTAVCWHHGDKDALASRDHPRNCPRDFYVSERTRCQHCKNGTSYRLGKIKYHVALYAVGYINGVGGVSFFHVSGTGASWTDAFAAADLKPKPPPPPPKPEPITALDYLEQNCEPALKKN